MLTVAPSVMSAANEVEAPFDSHGPTLAVNGLMNLTITDLHA
jgi:hypothetical protein